MKENYCSGENIFLLLCRNHLKLLDALWALPRRWGAPVAIVLYYLFKKCGKFRGQVISRHRMRHEPPTGAGLAQGGQPNLMKQVFYRAQFSAFGKWACQWIEWSSQK